MSPMDIWELFSYYPALEWLCRLPSRRGMMQRRKMVEERAETEVAERTCPAGAPAEAQEGDMKRRTMMKKEFLWQRADTNCVTVILIHLVFV